MNDQSSPTLQARDTLAKVPAVTLGFWVIKILATTLGETGADLFTQQYDMGYAAGIALFCVPLLILVAAQIRAAVFIRCSIGRRSSPRPRRARRWPISSTARWASATPGAARCCWPVSPPRC